MFDPPSAEAILAARKSLAAADPALAAVEAVTPVFGWRVGLGGFPGLLKMIVQQQVSLASAAAIWARVEAGLPKMTPEIVAAHDEAYLRTLGLSQPKARYARAIAEAHLSGACDFDALRALPDEEAIAALTAIKGVGRWTAEVFLMFTQGRLDLFPGGDVALQEAMRWVDRVEVRPTEKQAYARAELWRPYRGVAAHLLWACYGAVKRREIAPF
ncbi:DNA-3-methyladenine glycosylase II [Caulobacter sp. BE264]|uniref:DNA-3-methyladenine glycosylase family protein n=1 Tax=Caulobacter sp. BE264 TaxID=2817724 RepID=UPI00286101F2|nr:DNA-3-methyladenine glycosylase [Caulobacter sp. BE264]MDR7229962.1 DNA-3-methyladenine glycosylase II [Caulobacter sp. BE264]